MREGREILKMAAEISQAVRKLAEDGKEVSRNM